MARRCAPNQLAETAARNEFGSETRESRKCAPQQPAETAGANTDFPKRQMPRKYAPKQADGTAARNKGIRNCALKQPAETAGGNKDFLEMAAGSEMRAETASGNGRPKQHFVRNEKRFGGGCRNRRRNSHRNGFRASKEHAS